MERIILLIIPERNKTMNTIRSTSKLLHNEPKTIYILPSCRVIITQTKTCSNRYNIYVLVKLSKASANNNEKQKLCRAVPKKGKHLQSVERVICGIEFYTYECFSRQSSKQAIDNRHTHIVEKAPALCVFKIEKRMLLPNELRFPFLQLLKYEQLISIQYPIF